MNQSEKINLTNLNKLPMFKRVIRKLTINKSLKNSEKAYMLSCAIVFLKYYNNDNRYSSYRDFAYYIILKYSLNYKDYSPLYDFSVNYGFYPIAKDIINQDLLKEINLNDLLIDIGMDKYNNNEYFETYEQKKVKESLLIENSREKSYIAPTSFGKSSFIVDYIEKYFNKLKRIAIIVPTKSLLIQTYRMIRKEEYEMKIIMHEEMYSGEERFIAVFTQERALRFLEKDSNRFFDLLFIDEAHNIFKNNNRSILISRLIKKNMRINPHQEIIYLSPLVSNSSNLKVTSDQEIIEERINFNVKEPEIYECRLNNKIYQYNRFVNEFYYLRKIDSKLDYIFRSAKNKNFIYIRSPKKIEIFAKEFARVIEESIVSDEIIEVMNILKEFVHEDFFINDYLEKGIIYLHAKIPNLIKEYLEKKYSEVKSIKYLIANTVIIEGVNLPIERLFVLNTYSLYGKDLTNLIGRVNRLNNIFGSPDNLNKLLPQVHFVNTELYNRKKSNMSNKIKKLRSNIFEDRVNNPTLNSFDLSQVKDKDKKEKIQNIIEREKFINKDIADNEELLLKRYLIESGIDVFYSNIDIVATSLLKKIKQFKKNKKNRWQKYRMLDKIYQLFIDNEHERMLDFELSRLSEVKARNYYEMHIENSHNKSFKEIINSTVYFFNTKVEEKDDLFYFGQTYGEVARESFYYDNSGLEVYVRLSEKTKKELVNLAIVKIKMENDFISYKLEKLIIMLFEWELISEEEYNKYIYGTNDSKIINLVKFGLSSMLVSILEKNNQLKNINFDKNGNIVTNKEFDKFKNKVNDYYKFLIERML